MTGLYTCNQLNLTEEIKVLQEGSTVTADRLTDPTTQRNCVPEQVRSYAEILKLGLTRGVVL
mgnify:CR=1 FL=1